MKSCAWRRFEKKNVIYRDSTKIYKIMNKIWEILREIVKSGTGEFAGIPKLFSRTLIVKKLLQDLKLGKFTQKSLSW